MNEEQKKRIERQIRELKEQFINSNGVASQSAEHFEAAVDEHMKLEPYKGMERSEARRIMAGLTIWGALRMPEDVDEWSVEVSVEDIEEAKVLCDEAEAQRLFPFGFPIPPKTA